MRRALLLLSMAALLVLVAVPVQAGGSGNFVAHLSGASEVPANDSLAQGQTKIAVSDAGLHYKLIVANIEDVVAAHIHCGEAGVNGPVGVTLFSGGPVTVNGILAEATVTSPDAGNACGWTSISDVVDAIEAGGAYVNVHTVQLPGGEIRGQLH